MNELCVEVISLGPCDSRLEVTIPKAMVNEAYDAVYREAAPHIPIKGFRTGHKKVPRELVKAKSDKKRVSEVVARKLYEKTVDEAFRMTSVQPLEPPKILFQPPEENKDGGYAVLFEHAPRLKLKLEGEEFLVPRIDEARVEQTLAITLETIALDCAVVGDAKGSDETAEEDDFVRVHFTTFEKGSNKQLEDGEREIPLNSQNHWSASIIGSKVGDSFEVDHGVIIKGTLLEVKKTVVPPVDDALAQTLGFASLDALKEDIRQGTIKQFAQDRLSSVLIDEIIEHNRPIPLPRLHLSNIFARASERMPAPPADAGAEAEEQHKQSLTNMHNILQADVERRMVRAFLISTLRIQPPDQDEILQHLRREVEWENRFRQKKEDPPITLKLTSQERVRMVNDLLDERLARALQDICKVTEVTQSEYTTMRRERRVKREEDARLAAEARMKAAAEAKAEMQAEADAELMRKMEEGAAAAEDTTKQEMQEEAALMQKMVAGGCFADAEVPEAELAAKASLLEDMEASMAVASGNDVDPMS